MKKPSWALNDDRKAVMLTVSGRHPCTIAFDERQVEEVLQIVGNLRAKMEPVVPKDWPEGQKVRATVDPRYTAERDLLAGDVLFHIRDPRFGWLHFLFPRNEAKKIGKYLIARACPPRRSAVIPPLPAKTGSFH